VVLKIGVVNFAVVELRAALAAR
jgi:hypothetical protein